MVVRLAEMANKRERERVTKFGFRREPRKKISRHPELYAENATRTLATKLVLRARGRLAGATDSRL